MKYIKTYEGIFKKSKNKVWTLEESTTLYSLRFEQYGDENSAFFYSIKNGKDKYLKSIIIDKDINYNVTLKGIYPDSDIEKTFTFFSEAIDFIENYIPDYKKLYSEV